MNTKSWTVVIVLIIIAVAIGFTFTQKTSGTPSHMKIGVLVPLSGSKAELGGNFKKGIERAQEEYETAHPDQTIEVIYADDGYDAGKSLEAYQKLTGTDHVDALVVASAPAINAIYPKASKLSIPIIAYGTHDAEDVKDNVFQIFPDSVFADTALGFTMRTLNASTTQGVVGVYTEDPTLIKLYNSFQEAVGVDITEFALNPDMNGKPAQLRAVAEKVVTKNPKYIFMTNYASLGSQFLKELRGISGGTIKQTLVFDLTLNQVLGEYQKTLGDLKALEGSLVISPEAIDPKNTGELGDYGYDALSFLLASQARKGSQWITNLEKLKVKGVTGTLQFDEVGRRIPVFSVSTFKNGKIPEMK